MRCFGAAMGRKLRNLEDRFDILQGPACPPGASAPRAAVL